MKKILLIPDAAAGGSPQGATAGKPAAKPEKPAPVVLTVDTVKLEADLKDMVDCLEKDAAVLPPLLGFALTNLRGAVNSVAGHNGGAKK